MDRRKFLQALAGGTAAAVAVRSWPFRSYFFPKPAPRDIFTVGDIFIVGADWGFEPGQLIAAYGMSGGLANGYFRVVSVDSVARAIEIAYVEQPDLTGRPAWDDRGAGEWKGLSRAKYPGRLGPMQRPKNIDRVMAQFKSDLNELTEGIEQQDLLLRDVESPAASWKRKLLRA